jgi:hypothetical protein
MMIDGATVGEYATHPTISERIQALQQLTGDIMMGTEPLGNSGWNNFAEVRSQFENEARGAFGQRQEAYRQSNFQSAPEPAYPAYPAYNAPMRKQVDASSLSLFERVKSQPDAKAVKRAAYIKRYGGITAMIVGLVYFAFIQKMANNAFQMREVPPQTFSTQKADGTYSHNGEFMSKQEYEKMTADLKTYRGFVEAPAPAKLRSDAAAAPTSPGGLRGRNFSDDPSSNENATVSTAR